jgi:glycosyltransferase involved in cell wall biosynthesis
MENKTPPEVSIILAVFNEELSLSKELDIIKRAMDDSGYSYEVIVVDDASTDNSYRIAKQAGWVKLIRHHRNLGSGAARKTGLKIARGELAVWTDVDLSYPNEEIPKMIKYLKENNLDQVIAQRDTEAGTNKFFRFTAKWIIKKVASILANYHISDLNSGLRVFRRPVALRYLHLIPNGFSCVSTLTLGFLCNDYLVGFYPIKYKRRVGRSKFHPIIDTYNYLLQVIRMIMYFNPLRVILPISISLLLLGICTMTINIFFRHRGIEQMDILIILFSISMGMTGLLADLVVTLNRANKR